MNYKILIGIGIVFIHLNLFSQESNWFVEQNNAVQFAKENNTNILMVFAGSDWCRPCIKFKKDILESEEFKNNTNGQLAILYLDFPAKKKNKLSKEQIEHNESLAEQFNKSGAFPKIVLLDNTLKKIKDIKFSGQNAKSFVKLVQ